jgi:Fe2+ or Zn2+ uptake regulation protein
LSDTGSNPLTPKQTVVLEELEVLSKVGINPTVRSLADRLETRAHRSDRFTDDEVRGLLERLEEQGQVEQFEDDGKQRYRPAA